MCIGRVTGYGWSHLEMSRVITRGFRFVHVTTAGKSLRSATHNVTNCYNISTGAGNPGRFLDREVCFRRIRVSVHCRGFTGDQTDIDLQFCAIYVKLFHSKLCARQRELKSTLLSSKAELLATSAQDHFARWARLRRSVDKGLQDLEKTSESLFSF